LSAVPPAAGITAPETFTARPVLYSEGETTMASERHNSQAGEEQRGSSGDNIRQQQESRDPDKSNARDREGRKGGDNAKNL
jgi:hypothetical protein